VAGSVDTRKHKGIITARFLPAWQVEAAFQACEWGWQGNA